VRLGNGTGSGLCAVESFGISGVGLLSFTAIKLVENTKLNYINIG